MIREWIKNNLKGDPVIWAIVIALSILSIFVVYSATGTLAYRNMEGNTEHYLFRHTSLVLLSLFAMWVAHRIDYRYYARLSLVALIISIPLLIYSWQFGTNLNEASRWIMLPGIKKTFQPSDLAKLALIAHMAGMLARRQQSIKDFKESLIPVLLWCGVICGLIAMTNMSTALLLLITCVILLFIGRVPIKYLAMLWLVGILVGGLAYSVGQRGTTALNRVEDFFDTEEIPFQAKQSYIAIASGGVMGVGPGRSVRRNFLPHSYSDFIFAIIVEEYGVVGAGFVILLYLALLYRGMLIATRSERVYGGLLSAGLSLALVLQAVVNIGVAVGMLPITGLPLPLVSMGGTSLLFTGVSLGIIQSVNRGELEEITPAKGNRPKKSFKLAKA
jgi:cell division protein FtsW